MHVGVKDLLTGGFAIRDEEVDAVSPDRAGGAQRASQPASDREHAIRGRVGEIMSEDGVLVRYDEQVAGRDRTDVQEGTHQLVAMDEARRSFTGDDPAEDAPERGWLQGLGQEPRITARDERAQYQYDRCTSRLQRPVD